MLDNYDMVVKRNYDLNGVIYEGTITFKRMRRLVLRMGKKENEIKVSAPYFTTMKTIDRFVAKNLSKLISRVEDVKPPFGPDYLYLFGERIPFDGDEKKAHTLYKEKGLPYLEERVAFYKGIMGIDFPYKVKIRKMTSRWGVNNKKAESLTFSTALIAYKKETIDSVVVHELCHHFECNHGPKFYSHVYQHCPDYKERHTHLRRREYDR